MSATQSSNPETNKFEAALRKAFQSEYPMLKDDCIIDRDFRAAFQAGYDLASDMQQAKIDRLMLEYCPEEMTATQKTNWEINQKLAPAELQFPKTIKGAWTTNPKV